MATFSPTPAPARLLPEMTWLSEEWAEFVAEMGRAGVSVRRTTASGSLRDATAALAGSRAASRSLERYGTLVAHVAARAGFGWADLVTYDRAVHGTGPDGGGAGGRGTAPYQVVVLLHASLERLAEAFSQMTLRDGLGWAMAYPPPPRWVVREDLVPAVQGWHDVGIGPDGWVFAAAGLEPVETVAAIADGRVTRADARAVAALRGVALPVAD